jgi:hypothetical protein
MLVLCGRAYALGRYGGRSAKGTAMRREAVPTGSSSPAGQPIPLIVMPVARRFCGRYEDETLSQKNRHASWSILYSVAGKPGEMLELVSHSRPAAGLRRAFADRGHHAPDHARLFG